MSSAHFMDERYHISDPRQNGFEIDSTKEIVPIFLHRVSMLAEMIDQTISHQTYMRAHGFLRGCAIFCLQCLEYSPVHLAPYWTAACRSYSEKARFCFECWRAHCKAPRCPRTRQ